LAKYSIRDKDAQLRGDVWYRPRNITATTGGEPTETGTKTLPGGTLIVSKAIKLFPYYKKRLNDLGFMDVEAAGEEKDGLNMIINKMKPRLVLAGSGFYHAGTPYMAGRLLKRFPKLNIAAVSLGEFPDSLAVWFIRRE
jgi:hypothetical protein